MPLKAGTIADYDKSMAAAMEEALRANWGFAMPDTNMPISNDLLKLIFIAISQGVVNHLKENKTSFEIVGTTTDRARFSRGTTVTNIEII